MKPKYKQCEKEFIEENYRKYSFKVLTQKFNERFNSDRTIASMKTYCSKNGLHKTNGNGRFQNNHPAWNNGLTKKEYLTHCTDETRDILAKHRPPEHRQYKIGDRVIKKINGDKIPYIVTSVEPNIKFEKRLTPESRYIWELHNGAIPNKYYIMHIDGDAMNNDISNLVLVSESDRNSIAGNGWFGNAEIFKTGLSILELQKALKDFGRYEQGR